MKKRISIVTSFLLVWALLLSGCGGSENENRADVLTIRNTGNGNTLSIGDSRDTVNRITGGDEAGIDEFMEDGVIRIGYWDTPGLTVDFLQDKVVALHMTSDNTRWEIAGGVRIGMTKEKVMEIFKDNSYAAEGLQGGVLLAYDKELNPIEFSTDAPYYVTISFVDNMVDYILVQDNF